MPPGTVLELQEQINDGRLAQAEQAIAGLVRLHANDPALQVLLGQLALKKKDNDGAAAYFENAVALQPDLAAAHVALAEIYSSQRQPEQAQPHYEAALKVVPNVAELHNNLGLTYFDQGRLDEAERCFEEALRLKPDFAVADNNRGRVYSERRQFDRAVDCFRAALALEPHYIDAAFNEGIALRQLGENEQALERLEACHRAAPEHVGATCALGHTHFELARFPEAQQYFRAALALDPDSADAHFGLGNMDLLKGNMSAGWEQYEWRTRLPKFARYYKRAEPRWNGQELRGKTLVVNAEQGYGDVIMFARFLSRIVSRSDATVVFRCRQPLIRLMRDSLNVHRVIDIESGETVTAEAAIPLLSLGHMLEVSLDDLPGPMPYLQAAPSLTEEWRARVAADSRLRVGLAWRGNLVRAHERGRVPLVDDYHALAAVQGVSFYNLELGCSANDAASFPVPLVDLTAGIEDFGDTAALVENLDLVISVDTSIAHLCGAMGKSTWVLQPDVPDWRWEIAGRESPWYPSIRLFRRNTAWRQTLTTVAAALNRCVAGADENRHFLTQTSVANPAAGSSRAL